MNEYAVVGPHERPSPASKILARGLRLTARRDLHEGLEINDAGTAAHVGLEPPHVAGKGLELIDQLRASAGVVDRGLDLRSAEELLPAKTGMGSPLGATRCRAES
jgi:hypothetical protein